MLEAQQHQKISTSHLARNAYLYVRQSTLRQVIENTESTKRQYALRDRAIALGWPTEKVIVIDQDLGQSGASAVDRLGFQKLISEVGVGRAGIVLGLEVSRLARNSTDWHRLLEICALSGTLILDEDGLYDPGNFNDRLLLGLKGTMSEAELHVLKARLQGGIRAKARRGELETPLPIGFIYDSRHHVILDSDKQVQDSVRLLFKVFAQTGTASATVKYMRENQIKFPRRPKAGANRGELIWVDLPHHRVLWILHNPRYAGAFFYGRTRPTRQSDGTFKSRKLPQEDWISFKKDMHAGYISWEVFEENLKKLKLNSAAHGHDRRHGPAREGPALLQGLVVCGVCGKRMTVRYHLRKAVQIPDYLCQREGIQNASARCQAIPGESIDKAIGDALVEAFTPMALEVALKVQFEIESRSEDVLKYGKQQVQRARYDVDLARRRFMQVDPDNRLVADSLESEWNGKLKILETAQAELDLKTKKESLAISQEQKAEIQKLANNFPALWRDPQIQMRDRKRMVRLIIEDVTIKRGPGIEVNLRFKGGAIRTIDLPAPRPAWAIRKTDPEIIKEIDQLLNQHTTEQVASALNTAGKKSGMGQEFTTPMLHRIISCYRLKSYRERLRDLGFHSQKELAKRLQVSTTSIKKWDKIEILNSTIINDKGEKMFKMPDQDFIGRLSRSMKRGGNGIFVKSLTQTLNEV